MKEDLIKLCKDIPGDIGFYYKDIKSKKVISFNENQLFIAASVIKIPVLVETLKQVENGNINKDHKVKVLKKYKVPSCGALTYMHDDLEVTIEDLYTLMIIHSDNTATNMLVDMLGMENINNTLKDLGCNNSKINRLLFDAKAQNEGIENYITPYEIGYLLEKIYDGEIISKSISKEIERILKLQRLNHKMPYLLPQNIEIGHKTGEDCGITHDVGIVYSKKPFIFCFASNNIDVIKAEDLLRKMAFICYEESIK
ncbi:serine hydrolase [Anaerosalibacter massiliensis]|uniref:Class A beta-lactamase-related serine hydrolase n=1 Tax=Anaerosalibacter massiliensis TaxID=1347392 RepID=A0A9X2S6D1_9FIRM|nr:serine hydrolase [Anaerosalibacter massiliensis]MCR2043487.1 class A beta-lactamase-related serine hydrolase [Anaerosalibacter massiliensis]